MKRQFFAHGLVYGAANLVTGLGAVLLVPVYTYGLSPSEYGVVDLVVACQVLLQAVASLEITQGIARFYSSSKDLEQQQRYASTGLLFLLSSLVAVCAVIYLGLRAFGASALGLGNLDPVLGIALAAVMVRIVFYALQSQLRWQLRSDLYSVASLIGVAGSLAASAYFLLVMRLGVAGAFRGLAIGYGVACLFCLLSLRKTYRLVFDGRMLAQMLRFSAPLAVSAIALFFAAYGDRLILRSYLGFHDLGLYGIAARFAAVVTLAINGFQLGAAPLIYRHSDEAGTPDTLAQLMRLFVALGCVFVAGLAGFGPELVRLIAAADYQGAAPMIPVLALSILVGSLYTFLPGLSLRHLTVRFAAINCAVAGATLVLVAVQVRAFGLPGAASGALSGAVCGMLLHAVANQQVYPIPITWGRLAATFAITGAAIIACASMSSGSALGLRVAVLVASCGGISVLGLAPDDRNMLRRALISAAAAGRRVLS